MIAPTNVYHYYAKSTKDSLYLSQLASMCAVEAKPKLKASKGYTARLITDVLTESFALHFNETFFCSRCDIKGIHDLLCTTAQY